MARQLDSRIKRLFVMPVNPSVDHETIKVHFSQFGDVIDANNIKNYTSFVYCSSLAEARRIEKRTNGTHFLGRKLKVEVARVQGKNSLGYIQTEKLGICYGYNYPINYPENCKNPRCPNRHICFRCFEVTGHEFNHPANDPTCPTQTEQYTPYQILHDRDVMARSTQISQPAQSEITECPAIEKENAAHGDEQSVGLSCTMGIQPLQRQVSLSTEVAAAGDQIVQEEEKLSGAAQNLPGHFSRYDPPYRPPPPVHGHPPSHGPPPSYGHHPAHGGSTNSPGSFPSQYTSQHSRHLQNQSHSRVVSPKYNLSGVRPLGGDSISSLRGDFTSHRQPHPNPPQIDKSRHGPPVETGSFTRVPSASSSGSSRYLMTSTSYGESSDNKSEGFRSLSDTGSSELSTFFNESTDSLNVQVNENSPRNLSEWETVNKSWKSNTACGIFGQV